MPFDFPDFLPTDRPSNIQLGNISQIVSGTVFVTNLDTTPYNEVVIFGNNTDVSTYMQVEAVQFGAPGDPVQTVTYTAVFGPQQFGSFRVPIVRGILQTAVQNFGGTPVNNYQVGVYGISAHTRMYDLYSGTPSLATSNDALGTTGSKQHVLTAWYTGPVEVSAIGDSSGQCRALWEYYDANAGAWVVFNYHGIGGLYTSDIKRMTFPAHPVRYTVFNNGTAQNVELNVCVSSLNGI